MANRFTDTEKWKDEWFSELHPNMKILWLYILDTCDHAGVWKVNFKLASYSIGAPVDKKEALEALGSRIVELDKDKWHIPKFLTFQYRGKLNPANNAHKGAIKLLKYHGLQTSPYLLNGDRLKGLETQSDSSLGSKEQIQTQDKNKDQGKEEVIVQNSDPKIIEPVQFKLAGISNPDELLKYWNENLQLMGFPPAPFSLGGNFQNSFFQINKRLFQNKTTWIQYVDRVKDSNFLVRKRKGGPPPITWLLNESNFDEVMSGKYDMDGSQDDDDKLLRSVFGA